MIKSKLSALIACTIASTLAPQVVYASSNDIVDLSLTVTLPTTIEVGSLLEPTLSWGNSLPQGVTVQWYTISDDGVYSLKGVQQALDLSKSYSVGDKIVCSVTTDDGQHVESNVSTIAKGVQDINNLKDSVSSSTEAEDTSSSTFSLKSTVDLVESSGVLSPPVKKSDGRSKTVKQVTDDITTILDNMSVDNTISEVYINSILEFYLTGNDFTATVEINEKVVSTYTREGSISGILKIRDSLGDLTSVPFSRVIPVMSKDKKLKSVDTPSQSKETKIPESMLSMAMLGVVLKKKGNEKEETMSVKDQLMEFLKSYEISNKTSIVTLLKACKEAITDDTLTVNGTKFSRKKATEFSSGTVSCVFSIIDDKDTVVDTLEVDLEIPKLPESLDTAKNILEDYFTTKYSATSDTSVDSLLEESKHVITNKEIIISASNHIVEESTYDSTGEIGCTLELKLGSEVASLDIKLEVPKLPYTYEKVAEILNVALSQGVSSKEELVYLLESAKPVDVSVEISSISEIDATETVEGALVCKAVIGIDGKSYAHSFAVSTPKLKPTLDRYKDKVLCAITSMVIPRGINESQLKDILPKSDKFTLDIEDFSMDCVSDNVVCTCSITLSDPETETEEILLLSRDTVSVAVPLVSALVHAQSVLLNVGYTNDTDLSSLLLLVDSGLDDNVSIESDESYITNATFSKKGVANILFKLVADVELESVENTDSDKANNYNFELSVDIPILVEPFEDSIKRIESMLSNLGTGVSEKAIKKCLKYFDNPTIDAHITTYIENMPTFNKSGSLDVTIDVTSSRGNQKLLTFNQEVPKLEMHSIDGAVVLVRQAKINLSVAETKESVLKAITSALPEDKPFDISIKSFALDEPKVYKQGTIKVNYEVSYEGECSETEVVYTLPCLDATLDNLKQGVFDFFHTTNILDLETDDEATSSLCEFLGTDVVSVNISSKEVPTIFRKGSFVAWVTIAMHDEEECVPIELTLDKIHLSTEEEVSLLESMPIHRGIMAEKFRLKASKLIASDLVIENFNKDIESNTVTIVGTLGEVPVKLNCKITSPKLEIDEIRENLHQYCLDLSEVTDSKKAESVVTNFISNDDLKISIDNFTYSAPDFDTEGNVSFMLSVSNETTTIEEDVSKVLQKLELTVEESIKRFKSDLDSYFDKPARVVTPTEVASDLNSLKDKYPALTVVISKISEEKATAYADGTLSGLVLFSGESLRYSIPTTISVEDKLTNLASDISAELGMRKFCSAQDLEMCLNTFPCSVILDKLVITPARVRKSGSIRGILTIEIDGVTEDIEVEAILSRTEAQIESYVEDRLDTVANRKDFFDLVEELKSEGVDVDCNVDVVEPTLESDGSLCGSITVNNKVSNLELVLQRDINQLKMLLESKLKVHSVKTEEDFRSLINELHEISYLTTINKTTTVPPEGSRNGSISGEVILKTSEKVSVGIDITLELTVEQVVKYAEDTLTTISTEKAFDDFIEKLNSDLSNSSIKIVQHITKNLATSIEDIGAIVGVLIFNDKYSVNVGIPIVNTLCKLRDNVHKALETAQSVEDVYSVYRALQQSNKTTEFTISIDEVFTETGDKAYIVGTIGVVTEDGIFPIDVLVKVVLPTKFS